MRRCTSAPGECTPSARSPRCLHCGRDTRDTSDGPPEASAPPLVSTALHLTAYLAALELPGTVVTVSRGARGARSFAWSVGGVPTVTLGDTSEAARSRLDSFAPG